MSIDLDDFGKFVRKWNKCKACPLHAHAKTHVLFRGSIPAPILFVGEAPGKVEDKLGKPFVDPSGELLEDTLTKLHLNHFCITNVVCCIPWGVVGHEIRQPSSEEAEACSGHLLGLIKYVEPKLIISLGEVAKKLLANVSFPSQENIEVPVKHLRHPAYVLRRGGKDSAEHKNMILQLQRYCEEFEIGHVPYFTEHSYSKSITNASSSNSPKKLRSPKSPR